MKFFFTKNKKNDICVIFIHGLKSNVDTWNFAPKTNINIQKKISSITSTLMIQYELIDYVISCEKSCRKIYEFCINNSIINPIIVCHSIGGLYAKALDYSHHDFVKSIIFIDSICLNEIYCDQLASNIRTETNIIDKNIRSNIMKYILCNKKQIVDHMRDNRSKYIALYNTKKKSIDNDKVYWDQIGCETKIFFDIGHMIHHKRPDYIVRLVQHMVHLLL